MLFVAQPQLPLPQHQQSQAGRAALGGVRGPGYVAVAFGGSLLDHNSVEQQIGMLGGGMCKPKLQLRRAKTSRVRIYELHPAPRGIGSLCDALQQWTAAAHC